MRRPLLPSTRTLPLPWSGSCSRWQAIATRSVTASCSARST